MISTHNIGCNHHKTIIVYTVIPTFFVKQQVFGRFLFFLECSSYVPISTYNLFKKSVHS